jgi:hypothetical protein
MSEDDRDLEIDSDEEGNSLGQDFSGYFFFLLIPYR